MSQSCVLRANRAGEASSRVVRYVLPQTILFFAFLSVLIRCYSEEQDTSGQSRGAAAQRVCFIKCGFLELSTIATQEKKEGESQKHETPKHGSLIVFPPQMEVCFQQFFSSFFFFFASFPNWGQFYFLFNLMATTLFLNIRVLCFHGKTGLHWNSGHMPAVFSHSSHFCCLERALKRTV